MVDASCPQETWIQWEKLKQIETMQVMGYFLQKKENVLWACLC